MAVPDAAAGAPLILTLALDERAQGWFDDLRRAHFPPERNFLDAHLTLFHHLPAAREREVIAGIEEAGARQAPLALTATGPFSLGRGVAYALDSPALLMLRAGLAERWWPWLGPQDRGRFRPHVTVQNKVAHEQARALLRLLQEGFVPFPVTDEGLLLWRYLGGPWAPVRAYPFRGDVRVGGRLWGRTLVAPAAPQGRPPPRPNDNVGGGPRRANTRFAPTHAPQHAASSDITRPPAAHRLLVYGNNSPPVTPITSPLM